MLGVGSIWNKHSFSICGRKKRYREGKRGERRDQVATETIFNQGSAGLAFGGVGASQLPSVHTLPSQGKAWYLYF